MSTTASNTNSEEATDNVGNDGELDGLSGEEIRNMDVGRDPKLSTNEKETSLTFPNDTNDGLFYSEVPTTIKWFLSIEGSEITDYRIKDEQIVMVKGRVSKSYIKLQGSDRKSTSHAQMVSYGEQRE
jgi:hypothetical protein